MKPSKTLEALLCNPDLEVVVGSKKDQELIKSAIEEVKDLERKKGIYGVRDDREKWLKSKQMSVEEIVKILKNYQGGDELHIATGWSFKNLARAIHTEQEKRLR